MKTGLGVEKRLLKFDFSIRTPDFMEKPNKKLILSAKRWVLVDNKGKMTYCFRSNFCI